MSELGRTSGHESRNLRNFIFKPFTKNPERDKTAR